MVRDLKLRRIPASFKYAARGIWHVLRTEQNVQLHLIAAAVVLGLSVWFKISTIELAILLLAIGLVLAGEILNTVIEDFLDIIHPSHHKTVRRIKDALAGAVLVSAIIAAVIGLLIFLPHILAAFQPATV